VCACTYQRILLLSFQFKGKIKALGKLYVCADNSPAESIHPLCVIFPKLKKIKHLFCCQRDQLNAISLPAANLLQPELWLRIFPKAVHAA